MYDDIIWIYSFSACNVSFAILELSRVSACAMHMSRPLLVLVVCAFASTALHCGQNSQGNSLVSFEPQNSHIDVLNSVFYAGHDKKTLSKTEVWFSR